MNDIFKTIAEKASNLIGQNAEQMQKDWDASLKQQDEPESYKFPIAIKGVLTNKGGERACHLTVEWALQAKRSFGVDITDDGTDDMFDGKE